jgi:hypothetical protein
VLQIESEFLFQQESRNRIQDFLRNLFFQLNEKNEAFIDLGLNNNYLAVKLYRSPVKPPEIMDFEVPMFRKDRIDLSNLPWDISFQHLIPYIDGISHVKKIVYEVGMDIDSVKRSLKLLQFHGAVLLTDVFKFTNVYKLSTNSVLTQLSNPAVIQDLRAFSALHGRSSGALPTAHQVLSFLLQLQPNKSIQQILLDNLATPPEQKPDIGVSLESKSEDHADEASTPALTTPALSLENLDIPRLLACAQAYGIVRRVYEYPLYTAPPQPATSPAGTATTPGTSKSAQKVRGNSSADSLSALGGWRRDLSTASLESQAVVPSSRRPSGSRPQQQPQFALHSLPEQPSAESKSTSSSESSDARGRSLPVPAPANIQTADGGAGTSVGMSGNVSAGTSLNAPSFTKDIGMRRTSFGPEAGREVDRNANAAQGSTLARPGDNAQARMPGVTTPVASAAPVPTSAPPRTLNRHFSRSKMTAGQNFLQMSNAAVNSQQHSATSGVNSSAAAVVAPIVASKLDVRDILHKLNGKEHIDAICCRFDIPYHDIVNFPGVQLIYK